MVMIDGIPGLEAWVCVNDKRALEYEPGTGPPKVEEVDPTTSTKYIQSISGATFSLLCETSPDFNWSSAMKSPYRALGVYYKLDGKVDSIFNTIEMNQSQQFEHSYYMSADRRGRGVLKEFRFASVKTVESNDNERIENEKRFASQLGAIEIIVKRLVGEKRYESGGALVGEDSFSESDSDQSESDDHPETLEMTEKALKGRSISNLTSFSPVGMATSPIRKVRTPVQGASAPDRSCPSPNRPKRPRWHWEYHAKVDEQPFAIFRFLYRSMDDLQKQLIVPKDPAPTVKEEEKEGEVSADLQEETMVSQDSTPPIKEEAKGGETSIENLSMEEIMQLARERLEQRKAEVKVKTEEKPTTKRPHDEIIDVEKEDSIRQSRKSRRRVFVDLTE